MSPVIDFSEVKGIEPLPSGTYRCELSKATAGISKAGNKKIDLQWKVLEGAHVNRIVFDTLTFTEDSLGVVKSKLNGMGAGELVVDTDDLEPTCEAILGTVADLTVSIQKGNGTNAEGEPYNDRNRVGRIRQAQASLGDFLKG